MLTHTALRSLAFKFSTASIISKLRSKTPTERRRYLKNLRAFARFLAKTDAALKGQPKDGTMPDDELEFAIDEAFRAVARTVEENRRRSASCGTERQ